MQELSYLVLFIQRMHLYVGGLHSVTRAQGLGWLVQVRRAYADDRAALKHIRCPFELLSFVSILDHAAQLASLRKKEIAHQLLSDGTINEKNMNSRKVAGAT